jgi:hypothetical protein
MIGVTLLVCLTVLALAHRAERLLDRLVTLRERQLQPQAPQPQPEQVSIPPDLESVADRWEDQWARDQVRASMREKFAEYGNWNTVRRAYGLGEIDGGLAS